MVRGLILIARDQSRKPHIHLESQQLMYYDRHSQARTTAAIREQIRQAEGTADDLARRFGVSAQTIRKWRHRDSVHDRSHRPHRLQTSLNGSQENLVMCLRQALRLPLDDLLCLTRQFLQPRMSRSALDRALRRRGLNRLGTLKPQISPSDAHQGCILISVLPALSVGVSNSEGGLLISAELSTRWMYTGSFNKLRADRLMAYLGELEDAAPFPLREVVWIDGSRHQARGLARRPSERWRSSAQAMSRIHSALRNAHDPDGQTQPGRAPDPSDLLSEIVNTREICNYDDRLESICALVAYMHEQAALPCLNNLSPLTLVAQRQLQQGESP